MTTEARDPRVRQLVFELIDAAPAPPPFPEAGVAVAHRVATRARRPRSWAVAVLAALLVVGAVTAMVVARRTPTQHPVASTGAATVAYIDGRGLVVRSPSGQEMVVARGAVAAPRWSPSGDWLAYHERDALWAVRADGSHPTRLTGTASGDYVPVAYSWSPTVDALAVAFGD